MCTHRCSVALGALALLASTGAAQTTVLTEDFSSNVVPPAGWTELDRGTSGSAGWEPDPFLTMGSEAAWMDDYYGQNDFHLMTPALNFSGMTSVYLHAVQYETFPTFYEYHGIEISLNGGSTFVLVEENQPLASGLSALEVDLSALAGTSGVNVSFHYTGDFADEWRLDDIVIDDAAPPPPPPVWPNVPTAFQPASGYSENFESYAGTVPAHMATNALDDALGAPDPEAWCNIGQQGLPGTGGSGNVVPPYSGSYCLEMGLDPLLTNYHYVRNGLVIGLDGTGSSGLGMDFWAVNHGDESHPWDGVWVSDDGLNWTQVYGDWGSIGGSWEEVTDVGLSSTGLTGGRFLLLFSQTDNFPYGYLDGIGIDDIRIYEPSPTLSMSNLVAGSTATLSAVNCTPGGVLGVGYSVTGPGPSTAGIGPCGALTVDLSQPIRLLPLATVDGAGNATLSWTVPPGTTGITVWMQGLDVGSCTLTNSGTAIVG